MIDCLFAWIRKKWGKRQFARPLSETEQHYFSPYFQAETISQAILIEGYVPFWLRKRMCAVVLGKRIYIRAGIYQPDTLAGVTLLAHELTHVEQFLTGMNVLKYLWASRRGYACNPYEIEAYQKAAFISQQLAENCQQKTC